jgi:hypothetical protein
MTEKQDKQREAHEAFVKRKTKAGEKEIRGLWVPVKRHAEIKNLVRGYLLKV